MIKWKKVVTDFNIGPCHRGHGPTHSPFYVCFYDAFCILMKLSKISSVWIHWQMCRKNSGVFIDIDGKYPLYFSRLDKDVCMCVRTYVGAKWHYSYKVCLLFRCWYIYTYECILLLNVNTYLLQIFKKFSFERFGVYLLRQLGVKSWNCPLSAYLLLGKLLLFIYSSHIMN